MTRGAVAVARREATDAVTSPAVLMAGAVAALLSGGLFVLVVRSSSEAYLGTVYRNLALLLIFLTPVFTMRTVAEERHTGTLTMLRILPLSNQAIACGKLVALAVYLGVLVGPVAVFPATFAQVAEKAAVAPMLVGYAGLAATALVYLAVGFAFSAWSPHPFVAAFLSVITLLGLWLLDDLGRGLGGDAGRLLSQLSPQRHMEAWSTGVVTVSSAAFVVTLVVAAASVAGAGIARVPSR